MAGKLSGSAIQTGTITSTQLSTELGPVSSELQLVGSGVSLNVSNTAVFTGNVGIGTTSPSATLDVNSSASPLTLRAGSGGFNWISLHSPNNNNNISVGINDRAVVDGAGSFGINQYNSSGSIVRTALTVDSSGNFGIGTTNPVNSNGYTQITLNNATNGGGFHLQHNGNTAFSSAVDSSSVYLDFPTTRPVRFFQNGSEAIRLANGNFGIGTTNPIHLLQVNGNIAANAFYARNSTYSTFSETISGAMTVLAHNARASDVATNRIITQNSGYHSHFIRMYYDEGIAFHTTTGTRTANDIVYDFTTPSNTVSGAGERMRITPDGNVGIGGSPGSSRLAVFSPAATTITVQGVASGSAISGKFESSDGGAVFLGSTTNHDLRFLSNNTHRGTIIGSTGEYVIGDTDSTAVSSDRLHSVGQIGGRASLSGGAYARIVMQERSSNWISFVNGSGTHFGTIAVSGAGVSYGSNSDYRLKENIIDLDNATHRLKQLKPKRFNFKINPEKIQDGFLAHEVQDIVPEAVIGEKDGYIATGNVFNLEGELVKFNVEKPKELEEGMQWIQVKNEPKYQTLDTSYLVPLLTKALQETIEKLDILETEINFLKNKN
jgi:hypothetical protein